jgi:HAD superfamily hydrolase (TIGR01490 family)
MPDYRKELQFGIFVTPVAADAAAVLQLAKLADVVRLDLVTFQDHPYQARFLDTWTLLSVVAAQTSTVRVAPNVANLPLRQPVVLARSVASLDILSGGRVEFGIGSGWEAYEHAMFDLPYGSPAERLDRLDESLVVIRSLWTEAQTNFEGSFYRVRGALAEPKPGWIRGFRMAEPVIISYARGMLKEFPGVPEGIVDVIPVDLVVAAIIAVAAKGPDTDPTTGEAVPEVVQVASGSQNPLRYRRLVNLVSGWFKEHPLYDNDGQPIVVPEWTFPGRGRVQDQLTQAKSMLERAEKILGNLPLRGKQAELNATIEERREELERALGYVELYGAYAECEAVYGLDRLLALWDAQTPEDQATFLFDPRAIDWDRYVREIHLPSVVEHGRVKSTPGARTGPSRADRLRSQVLSPERHLAAFDLENTLIASNVVASYSWLATRRLPPDERLRFVARTLAEGPSLLALDRKDRSDFLRLFYRRYDGAPVGQIQEDAAEMFSELILAKSFPAAIRRVREHRRLGHRTVLITGALDFVIDPLRPLFDDIVCAELGVRANGTYNGELTNVPPTGETRAQALMDFAAANDLDLRESVAYADSTSDLPMLEAVGFPVAVNPETRLATLARKRGWLVEQWAKSPGAPRVLVPIGGRRRKHSGLANPLVRSLGGSTR